MILSSLLLDNGESINHQTNRSSHDTNQSSPAASLPQSIASIQPPPRTTTTNTTLHGIPKILWMYWDQGIHHLEQIGSPNSTRNKYQADHACVKAWQILHPTWEIRILNRTQAMQVAPKFAHLARIPQINDRGKRLTHDTRICPVKLGNLLRTELLTLYGGVYTDTSICPMRPLEDYLGKLVGGGSGFDTIPYYFGASLLNHSQLQQYETCHIRGGSQHPENQLAHAARMVDNFFLAARPGNYVLHRWTHAYYQHLLQMVQITLDHLDVCLELPYFIHQCIFPRLVLQDAPPGRPFRDSCVPREGIGKAMARREFVLAGPVPWWQPMCTTS